MPGKITPGQWPGSLSGNSRGCREILVFGCEGDRSVVWRSLAGVDAEAGPDRVVGTMDREEVASLRDGQSCEVTVTTDNGVTGKVRFTHRA